VDCLVHPQVGTEAFPGVVLEAFACGRPVIASALDGIPEGFAIGGKGRLVTPENIEELARALAQQARQPRLTESERADLHQRIEIGHSLPAAARKVEAFYRRLLSS
jgi:glycosyltransferase involved in cell wall biosynthesis